MDCQKFTLKFAWNGKSDGRCKCCKFMWVIKKTDHSNK